MFANTTECALGSVGCPTDCGGDPRSENRRIAQLLEFAAQSAPKGATYFRKVFRTERQFFLFFEIERPPTVVTIDGHHSFPAARPGHGARAGRTFVCDKLKKYSLPGARQALSLEGASPQRRSQWNKSHCFRAGGKKTLVRLWVGQNASGTNVPRR